jgi:hypothetical protein
MKVTRSSSKIRQASGINSKLIKGVIVLIEPNKKYLQELNPVASRLWELCSKPITEKKLITAISKEYKIDQQTAAEDIKIWIKDYLDQGLLTQLD